MNEYPEFDQETRELFQRLDKSIASYHEQAEKEWQPKKQPMDTRKPATDPYTTRREILESCKKTTPGGGSYIALGEYYRKLSGR